MNPEHIIKRPIALTEKAARLKEQNKVVFEVNPKANKIEIRQAVEEMFDVKVTDVSTLVNRGKVKRLGRRLTKRPNWKKAIVTLREGDDIQFFDESEYTLYLSRLLFLLLLPFLLQLLLASSLPLLALHNTHSMS